MRTWPLKCSSERVLACINHLWLVAVLLVVCSGRTFAQTGPNEGTTASVSLRDRLLGPMRLVGLTT
jgi:hypothetical protein